MQPKLYKWAICLFFLINTSYLLAQEEKHIHQCKLVCKVYDAKTKEALPQATVQLLSHNKGETTNQNGHAELHLNEACKCACQLKVSFVGYEDFNTKFFVTSDTAIHIYLNEDSELLETVVVEDKAESSGVNTLTVSKMDKDVLASKQGESIGNALESLSGVTALKSGSAHNAKPVVHGLHGNRVLIQYNGVRMEGQQWGIEHAPELDGFLAEELAVVKGAAGVRYGANALGGVVLVNPASLPTKGGIGGKVNLVGMSNGRMLSGALMLEGGFGESDKAKGWGWRVQGSGKKGGDLHAPDYQLTNTGVEERNYSLALGKQGSKWGFELFYSHFSTNLGVLKATGFLGSLDDREYAFGQEIPQGTSDFSYDIRNPRQEAQHNLLKAKLYFDRSIGRVSLQYGFQFNKRTEFDVRIGALNEIPSMNLKINTHTLDLDLEHKPIGRFSGNIGINAMYQKNQNIFGTQRSHFIPNFTSPTVGAYIIERWTKDKLQLEAGLRYDFQSYDVRGWHEVLDLYYDAFQMQNLSATVGAIYQLDEKQTISTNIGTAWRTPHVSELYSFGKHQSNGSYEFGLLWPETTGYEIELTEFSESGVENEQSMKWVTSYQLHSENSQLEISAYINWIQNYTYLRPENIDFFNLNGILPFFDYVQGNALFRGVDMQFSQQLNDLFRLGIQGSYLRAVNLDNRDSELPLIPANNLSADLRYQKASVGRLKDVFTSLNIGYTFRQENAPRVLTIEELEEMKDTNTQPFEADERNFDFMAAPDGFALINLEAGFKLDISQSELAFRIGVRNLFNTRYRSYTNRLRYFADDVGRNFTLSLQYQF